MAGKIGIQITPNDNVLTVVGDVRAGDTVRYMTPQGHGEITAAADVPFGHKVALRDIQQGEPIVKYDEAIGTASVAIRAGEHVHAHNVQSAVEGAEREKVGHP